MRFHFGFVIEYAIGHVTYANILKAAVDRDPEVTATWFFMTPEKQGRLENLPPFRSNYTLYMGLRVLRQVGRARRELDAVLIHTQTAALLWWPMMGKLPTVISTDGTPGNIDELSTAYIHRQGSPREEDTKRRIIGRMLRASAHLIPWSDWTRRSLVEDYAVPEKQLTLIRPGVDLLRWGTTGRVADDTTRFLFVGGDFRRKGGEDLLAAASGLQGQWELHIVTKSTLPPRPGVTVYNDVTPDDPVLTDLYARCDVFVLPTLGDTYGWALLEAMAAGLPVISTAVGAIPEIVSHGDSGFVVRPGDVVGLRQALQSLVNDPDLRTRMGCCAQELATGQHDERKNAQAVLDVLKMVAVGSRR